MAVSAGSSDNSFAAVRKRLGFVDPLVGGGKPAVLFAGVYIKGVAEEKGSVSPQNLAWFVKRVEANLELQYEYERVTDSYRWLIKSPLIEFEAGDTYAPVITGTIAASPLGVTNLADRATDALIIAKEQLLVGITNTIVRKYRGKFALTQDNHAEKKQNHADEWNETLTTLLLGIPPSVGTLFPPPFAIPGLGSPLGDEERNGGEGSKDPKLIEEYKELVRKYESELRSAIDKTSLYPGLRPDEYTKTISITSSLGSEGVSESK